MTNGNIGPLTPAHGRGHDGPRFYGEHAFAAHLSPLRKLDWVVYAKPPLAGPKAVLAYLSRYTHRVALSNSRLIALDDKQVIFKG